MSILPNRRLLTVALATALTATLSACGGGGGGGNVRPTPAAPPPAPAPAPAPPPAPAPAPPPPSGPTPSTDCASYAGIQCNQLTPANVVNAWSVGGTATSNQGQGVKVGVLDTGADATNAGLTNRISWFKDYVTTTNTSPTDPDGHGTTIAELIGGTANPNGVINGSTGTTAYPFEGGVAPQSSLYIARVGDATGTFQTTLIPPALNDLMAQGVRLFNNSYGSTTAITSVAASDSNVQWPAQQFGPIVSGGGLMVFAAGNDGHSQPSIEAGLPYYVPALQKGWLAVVNVALDGNGHVTGLSTATGDASNACGVAAPWCLAAPGYDTFTPVANTTYKTGAGNGTSASTAIVTGVAALVWQRFPWMTANNVQETLLGTATPLGDPALYGYGLVNAGAAVHGPGKFDWGVFDAIVPSGAAGTFSNPITGTGSLQLDGGGALTLSGVNTYTGGTVVNGGTLSVDGSLASNVTVFSGGTLAGAGTIHASVSNSGTVSTAGGALAIDGNYSPQPTANTAITIGTPLHVGGTAGLNGSVVTATVPSTYTPKSVEPLVQAASLTGTFSKLAVTGSVYLGGTLSYTPTEADVALSRTSVASMAVQFMPALATTQQTAQHLEGALQQADQWAVNDPTGHADFLQAANSFLHAASTSQAIASINSLSGQILASSQALTFAQAGIVSRTLANRLQDAHGGGHGAWVQGTGVSGDIARTGYASGSYDGGGAIAGYDTAVTDQFTAGAAVTWNRMTSTYSLGAGSSSTRSTGVSLYGRYDVGAAYLAGRIGQEWVRADVNRWGLLGTQSAAIHSDRQDHLTVAYGEAGYGFHGSFDVTPFVGVDAARLRRGGINEQGAGGFGIAAGAHTFDQTAGVLGARLGRVWSSHDGQIAVQGYALWKHLFSGQSLGFTAAYAGAPTASFALEGVNAPRDSGWVGVGVSADRGNGWSWFGNVDGQVAGHGNKASVLSAGVRYRF
ncbi:S8 family serine peptidase [Rhodanobacter sp. FW106-PBR-R2A-1-13]|uniref:S8 family serine peptidase n=1 Tax=Rhodanobacter sp. FW106-PBR-R2A-1-13 TaxID=3454845 RepID=UPI0034E4D081